MNDFMGRTMTKMLMGALNSHQSIIHNHGMDSFYACYYHET